MEGSFEILLTVRHVMTVQECYGGIFWNITHSASRYDSARVLWRDLLKYYSQCVTLFDSARVLRMKQLK